MNREELIESLREEIAKRDMRIGELENDASYYAARNEELRSELAAAKPQVVMPEREECDDDRKHPNSWTDYAIGWNACRREVKRLNSDKENK